MTMSLLTDFLLGMVGRYRWTTSSSGTS